MTIDDFKLTEFEASYVVASLKMALIQYQNKLEDKDRKTIKLIMDRLISSMDVSPDVQEYLKDKVLN